MAVHISLSWYTLDNHTLHRLSWSALPRTWPSPSAKRACPPIGLSSLHSLRTWWSRAMQTVDIVCILCAFVRRLPLALPSVKGSCHRGSNTHGKAYLWLSLNKCVLECVNCRQHMYHSSSGDARKHLQHCIHELQFRCNHWSNNHRHVLKMSESRNGLHNWTTCLNAATNAYTCIVILSMIQEKNSTWFMCCKLNAQNKSRAQCSAV